MLETGQIEPHPINEDSRWMQWVTVFMKGTGIWPTSFLLRWEPSPKNPFRFGLLEVSKCNADGGVVTKTMPQHLRRLHSGHRIGSPKTYSMIEFIKVQIRWIR